MNQAIFLVMGVSGSGKTTVGQLLATRLGLPFHDGDDFHSAANIAKMAPKLMSNASPMNFHAALGALKAVIRERPDAMLVNEGANTLDLARGIIDMYQPRKRLDVGTWGIMGIGMGFAVAAAVETGLAVIAIEGDSAFGFSGMEVETICRYHLPVCIVVFNNAGTTHQRGLEAGHGVLAFGAGRTTVA